MCGDTISAPLTTAVITGAHPFDVPGFHRLFREMEGIDAYIQDLENYNWDWGQMRDRYDVVLFYNMHMHSDELAASVLNGLGRTQQGIVFLHHALLAYPDNALWSELVGISDRRFGYHPDQSLTIQVADQTHPITTGMVDWVITDESYTMQSPDVGSHALLTVDHPLCMRTVGWTRTFRQSRVFCLALGHDQTAWANPEFRTVLRRGILWAGGRLGEAS